MLAELARLNQTDEKYPPGPGKASAVDKFRRSKMGAVEKITSRPLIVYGSACTSPLKRVPGDALMLDFSDKIGFKAVTENIAGPDLDVLVHSPGGYASATESIVQQLRSKYSSIRFIVPSFAKSAATMLVMSGNEILMDTDAELGPIDPQMRTPNGISPAEAILEQFRKAQSEIKEDPSKLTSWMPILSPLGPSLLVDCHHAIELAKALVRDWSRDYMFAGDPEAARKADVVCSFLSAHANFKDHARPIKIPDLLPLGVKVRDLRDNKELFEAVEELYCCIDILFANSGVYKIFENSEGEALIRQTQQVLLQQPVPIKKKS